MCLILFALNEHPDYPLVIAANRDEYYQRPTLAAHFWDDSPSVLAGRDLQARGTWMGVTTSGRFAAVTNYREPMATNNSSSKNLLSRGKLTSDYLTTAIDTQNYIATLKHNHHRYAGYNLLVGDWRKLTYVSNRTNIQQSPGKGVYGLSNGLLNTQWPKVTTGIAALKKVLSTQVNTESLLEILRDSTPAADNELPDTGINRELEKALSSRFIHTLRYGTRVSTVILIDKLGDVTFLERSFLPDGNIQNTVKVTFSIENQT